MRVFTFRPPVFSFIGVRKGSKIMWLVSMLTGDCLFPTEHRFQAEFTSPQNDGTATQKTEWVFKRVSICTSQIGEHSTERSHSDGQELALQHFSKLRPASLAVGEMVISRVQLM